MTKEASSSTTSAFSTIVLIFVVGFLLNKLRLLWKPHKNYPPGPIGLPVFGHLVQLGDEPWKTLLKWKATFGPIFSVRYGGFPAIILTDPKHIREAFSMKVFSGRPKSKYFTEVSKGKGLIWSDGPFVAEQRQFVMKCLRAFGFGRDRIIEDKIKEEVVKVLEDLRDTDSAPIRVDHRFIAPILNGIWGIFMGQTFPHGSKELQIIADRIGEMTRFDGLVENLSMFVPFLSKFFPEASGHKKKMKIAEDFYSKVEKELEAPRDPTYVQGQPRNFKEAFIDQMKLKENDPDSSFQPSRNLFGYTCGDVLIAAMETTETTLVWWLIYMVRHPEVQTKFFAEIESILGTTGLPDLKDRPKFHYAEAVMSEVHRHASINRLGGYHRTLEDVPDFHGFFIPQDTLLVGNMYGTKYDPTVWKDPDTFMPDRFLDSKGEFQRSDNLLTFSAGLRSCMGENVARDTLFLYSIGILQRFSICLPPGDPLPSLHGIGGFVYKPKPTKLIFKPRFEF